MKITRSLPVLLALATGAFAQDPAAKQALAHEVIVAMHADRMFDTMVAQTKQLSTEMLALPPTATPEQRKQADEAQAKIMQLTLDATKGMMVKMNQIYAELYTDAELNSMKAFFTSPEGQSMLTKQGAVLARIRPLFQDMQRDLGPRLEKIVADAKPAAPATVGLPTPAPATPGK
jgi:hypothetical protein